VGKLADLVVWKPAFFGVKPELILKGGLIACQHGRSERLDSHAAADVLPPAIRRARPREMAKVLPMAQRYFLF
jgi:urease alpha subunit